MEDDGETYDNVKFRLYAATGSGDKGLLLEREWSNDGRTASWEEVSVSLADYVTRTVTLEFQVVTQTRGGYDRPVGICLVSDPQLVGPTAPALPNVILISIETLRRDHLGLYGYGRKTSPFLEEMAKEALVFENAYSQSSWTRPSVATILTGLYPSQQGCSSPMDRLADTLVSLPEILREHGYTTAAFCTGHVISRPAFNYCQGFDLFVDEQVRALDQVRCDTLSWLDVEDRKPFFMFMHTYDPHYPYVAPGHFRDAFADVDYEGVFKDSTNLTPDLIGKKEPVSPRDVEYIRARYDGEIAYTDAVLRRLAADLKERGLWDNTLLVITSDHGEQLKDHGGWGHAGNLFPEVLRVPLIVKLPGQARGGQRLSGMASGVDIMPTILGAVGAPVPEDLAGIDLLGSSEETGRTGRSFHFAELWGWASPPHRSNHLSVISERFQYISIRRGDGTTIERLFDLQEDPAAQRDLVAGEPEAVKKYARMVRDRYDQRGYTIAANGDEGEVYTFSGTVQSEAPIVAVEGLRTEEEDSFELDPGKHLLRFELTVANDDDVLRFETEPSNAPVTITVEYKGGKQLPEHVFLGLRKVPAKELPVTVPATRCEVDSDFGIAPNYFLGKQPGLYIWRQGISSKPEEPEARPDEETLRRLKDLGYL